MPTLFGATYFLNSYGAFALYQETTGVNTIYYLGWILLHRVTSNNFQGNYIYIGTDSKCIGTIVTTWNNRSISWYFNNNVVSNPQSAPRAQCNAAGQTNYYICYGV